uniref:CSON005593 protein n=1 Tax=Culicoides sonorensis TaxID=179676 RepID=A0A336MT61_CULSO
MLTISQSQTHQRNDDLLNKLDLTMSRRPNEHFLESGPIIYEYDEGTKCENCKDECPGYKSHEWRILIAFSFCKRVDG